MFLDKANHVADVNGFKVMLLESNTRDTIIEDNACIHSEAKLANICFESGSWHVAKQYVVKSTLAISEDA